MPKLTPRLPYPPGEDEPFNEFRTPYLATMDFPCLFITGTGDRWEMSANSEEKSN